LLGTAVVVKNTQKRKDLYDREYAAIGRTLQSDKINLIKIYTGKMGEEHSIVLKKRPGDWIVASLADYKANGRVIEAMVEHLALLEGELRSSSDEILSDYYIADQEGLHVRLYQDGDEHHYVIGMKNADFEGGFIRLAGSPDAYYVRIDLLGGFGLIGGSLDEEIARDYFCDKLIFDIDEASVNSITLARLDPGKEQIVIKLTADRDNEQNTTGWTIHRNGSVFPAKKDEVKSYISGIKTIEALNVLPLTEELQPGFDQPTWELTFEFLSSRSLAFTAKPGSGKEGGKQFLHRPGERVALAISEYAFNELNDFPGVKFQESSESPAKI